jgi:hypothetical protein
MPRHRKVSPERCDYRWEGFVNDRGNEGWELVSVAQRTVPGKTPNEPGDEYTLFFKRPR